MPAPIIRVWQHETACTAHVYASLEIALHLVDQRTRMEMLYRLQRLRHDLWREPLQLEPALVRGYYEQALTAARTAEERDREESDRARVRPSGHSDPTASEAVRTARLRMRLESIDLALTRLLEEFGFCAT